MKRGFTQTSSLTVAAVVTACAAAASIGVTLAGQSAQSPPPASQGAGTLDKQKAEKVFPAKTPYSPYAGRNYPTRPYFGDTHLHTSFSMDAGAFGARLGPRDAYRFA